MLHIRVHAEYEYLSQIERGCSTGLKEAEWSNRSIVHHSGRWDAPFDDADRNRKTMSKE